MRIRSTLRLCTLALTAAILTPASSSAAVTVGVPTRSLTTDGLTNVCSGMPCTYVPFSAGGAGALSRTSGVIVRWRLASNSSRAAVRLRVLRPGPNGTFDAVGSSDLRSTRGAAVNAFPTRVAIRANDALGLDNGSDALLFKAGVTGASARYFTPLLATGARAATPAGDSAPDYQLQLNADVEPDADRDGFGDQTQDDCPGDAKRHVAPCAAGGPPTLSGLGVSNSRFRFGSRLPRLGRAVPVGTIISFRLNVSAAVTVSFVKAAKGRRQGGRCVRGRRTGRPCTVVLTRATLKFEGRAGRNRLRFQGRLARGKDLPTGRYTLTARATDGRGRSSRSRSTSLTLLP